MSKFGQNLVKNHDFGWSEMTWSAWVMAKHWFCNNVVSGRLLVYLTLLINTVLAITHADHVISYHPNHDFGWSEIVIWLVQNRDLGGLK